MNEKKLIEYGIEALIITWLGYLFLYQNYLLREWHRGLPLPGRGPFVLGGIAMGVAFFAYEYWKLQKAERTSGDEDEILPTKLDT